MPAAHRESHVTLLSELPAGGQARPVDAVVVAAGRTVGHLRPAARLAAALGCELVALCSDVGATPDEVRHLSVVVPGVHATAVQVPTGYSHPYLRFATSDRPEALIGRLGMLSVKRNLGLLIGRMLGWRAVVFLDDDIDRIAPSDVRRAARALDGREAVGLAVIDWPDHSVVCHANLLGGGAQGVFVSGSALVVDPSGPVAFFPKIYNEDWLFLHPALRRRAVSRAGAVRQLPYNPFEDGRAWDEEFGEVIAEGLVAGLHARPAHHHERGYHTDVDHWADLRYWTDLRYWAEFLESRRLFIARARDRVDRNARHDMRRPAALRALDAAERHRSTIRPESCARYCLDWQADLGRWRRNLAETERCGDIETAVGLLNLHSTAPDLVP